MADLKYYDVILKPVITEASMAVLENKKYTFLVCMTSDMVLFRMCLKIRLYKEFLTKKSPLC